jgi:hypothetical protein
VVGVVEEEGEDPSELGDEVEAEGGRSSSHGLGSGGASRERDNKVVNVQMYNV